MNNTEIITLTDKDIDNFKDTLDSIFTTIWIYNEDNEYETFEVECIGLTRGEWETLVKIAKQLFSHSELIELNSCIVEEARIPLI